MIIREESHVNVEHDVHSPRVRVPDLAGWATAAVTAEEVETRRLINELIESVRHDCKRSNELFHYVWTMICVRRGLLRVVREVHGNGSIRLVLEEVRTGRHRLVLRPRELDAEIEGLAVQALTRILGDINPAR